MEKLTYVTGNYGKYYSVKKYFEQEDIPVAFFKHDAMEPMINDITTIAKAKVEEAYQLLKSPCFVADSAFYIDHYPNNPGYPGAFVKRSGVSSHIDSLLETMKEEPQRSCRFVDCLAFYDGKDIYYFYATCKGTLTYEKRGNHLKIAKSKLWEVFIPEGYNKTLAEMTEEETEERRKKEDSATKKFIAWYKKEYLNREKEKVLVR